MYVFDLKRWETRRVPLLSSGIGLVIGAVVPALLELFAYGHLRTPAPGILLLTAVVLSAFVAGTTSGLITSAMLSAYSFYAFGFFSDSGSRTLTFVILAPLVALCVGLLKRRTLKMVHQATESKLLEAQSRADSQIADERTRAVKKIAAKDEQFRAAIESSIDSFTLMEAMRDDKGKVIDFRVVQVNGRMATLTAYTREQMIGKRICELFPVVLTGGFMGRYVKVLETGLPSINEYQIKDGKVNAGWLHQQVVRVGDGVAVLTRDLTEQKALEEQLGQSQKMEGIGRLAGGIAHDFNNLLTIILGYAELASSKQVPGQNKLLDSAFKNILVAGGRAAELTRQLLAFARKQVIEPRVIDLNGVVAEAEKMISRVIGEDIEVFIVPLKDLWNCKADPGQITQILINLSVNARDAMPKGGKLTIESSNAALDESYCHTHPDVKPGEFVMLAVSDTGHGMDEETKKHVFEPFFTTKSVGKGTGLGLATCYGIVKQSGGHIWYYSEVGMGTTFKVYLPRVQEAQSPAQQVAVPVIAKGTETILLVEDESMLRDFAALTLRSSGYEVYHAPSGKEALAKALEIGSHIDLLVTDVVMPGMSGKQLAEQLRSLRPKLKVLYMSGYTANVIVHHGVLEEGVQFLPKPFTPSQLATKVREVLDLKSALSPS